MKTNSPLARSLALGSFPVGTELQIFPATGSTWIVYGLTFDFVTSAVVAARQSVLSLESGGGDRVCRIPQNSTQAASLTRRTSYYPGAVPGAGVGIDVTLPLPVPGLIVRSGWVLQTRTAAIDPGDQYTNVVVSFVELYPTASEALAPPVAQLFTAGQSV